MRRALAAVSPGLSDEVVSSDVPHLWEAPATRWLWFRGRMWISGLRFLHDMSLGWGPFEATESDPSKWRLDRFKECPRAAANVALAQTIKTCES